MLQAAIVEHTNRIFWLDLFEYSHKEMLWHSFYTLSEVEYNLFTRECSQSYYSSLDQRTL